MVFWFVGFTQRLGRGNRFWVELRCLLLCIICLDSDIFGLGLWVFVVSWGCASYSMSGFRLVRAYICHIDHALALGSLSIMFRY